MWFVRGFFFCITHTAALGRHTVEASINTNMLMPHSYHDYSIIHFTNISQNEIGTGSDLHFPGLFSKLPSISGACLF